MFIVEWRLGERICSNRQKGEKGSENYVTGSFEMYAARQKYFVDEIKKN
jgi:hypothetical protein